MEKQKYNYLKPAKAIKQAKTPQEKKLLVKQWFKFAFKCTKLERRSKNSGLFLIVMSEREKKQCRNEVWDLLNLKTAGSLPKEKEDRFHWLLKLFSLKELTELVKKCSYENFKQSKYVTNHSASKNKKKVKDISFEQINFFSLNELPEQFNYLEFKVTLRHSVMCIRSDDLLMDMSSSHTCAEYKARNTGNDVMLNVSEIEAGIEHVSKKRRDVVSYGKVQGEDIITLLLKTDKNENLIFGRIRRIYLFYKPEIFSLVNRFIDVFEDSFALGNKFSTGTQDYLQTSGGDADKSNDIINIKIEAPIVLIAQQSRLWIADLGTFDVKKDALDHNPHRITLLEGKKTKLYFMPTNTSLHNLNNLSSNPSEILEIISHMNLIISDLEFSVGVYKTLVKAEDSGSKKDKKVSTVDMICQPFKVDLIPLSMESFFAMLLSLSKDSSRERDWIEKIKKRSELHQKDNIEYNLGYEYWDRVELIIENQVLHVVNKKGKWMGSYPLKQLMDVRLEENEGMKHKKLLFTFKYKKLEFQSDDRKILSEVQFKVNSIRSILKEDMERDLEAAKEDKDATDSAKDAKDPKGPSKDDKTGQDDREYSDDAIMGFKFKAIDLTVAGYHQEAIPFFIKLEGASYLSKYLNGVEDGSFKLQSLQIQDRAEQQAIIAIRQEEQALGYSFKYREGSIESALCIKYIESTYKEEYIRSLLRLVEFVLDRLLKEDVQKDVSQSSVALPDSENVEISFEPPAAVRRSAKSNLKVSILHSKASIFYKKHIRCVELLSKNIEASIILDTSKMEVSGEIGDVGLYDLHRYPFKEEEFKAALAQKIPFFHLKRGGSIKLHVVLNETDTTASVSVDNMMVNWVQQRAMRFIDFVMYQVLEVFYPSLFSLAKYYSKENVIKFSLSLLNDPSFVKQHISMRNIEFNLCSTTNMDHKIALVIQDLKIVNDRRLLLKTVNADQLQYFPFGELESDVWSIDMKDVHMLIVDESLDDEMQDSLHKMKARITASDYFDLKIEVDFLAKMFELSFLYDIVDDLENFPPEQLSKFNKHFLHPPPGVSKQRPSVDDIKAQAKRFLQFDAKEKLYVNGRYNIKITSERLGIRLTNMFINKLYAIASNNINFDDGKDAIFRNTYVNSTQGLQIFMNINFKQMQALVPDFNESSLVLFSWTFGDLHFTVNKKSNYVNLIDFAAKTFTGDFNPTLGIPEQYHQFLRFNNSNREDLASIFMKQDKIQEMFIVKGSMKLTPDYKKDIEVNFYNIRFIAFTFIVWLFPGLLSLEPLVEHKGYEDPNFSKIKMLIRMHKTEICLVSNKEYCLVICGDVEYKIVMDDKMADHTINLTDAEIFDCNEKLFLNNSVAKVPKRSISRKFDLKFQMVYDILNNVDYAISSSNILTKMTAFNVKALNGVATFQWEWDAKMLKYSLADPKMTIQADYKTKTTFDLENFSFVFVDNYKNIFLPVLRFDFKMKDFRIEQLNGNSKLGGCVEFNANYNNSRTAKWEPFIEAMFIDFQMNSTQQKSSLLLALGMEGTSEGVYINFSEELLEVLLHIVKNANNIMTIDEKVVQEDDEDEGIIYDSQFLIRNKTGYDFFIQTVGDRKGKKVKIKNLTERFVNFIILDEFSTKDSTNRDVILTFGGDVQQKMPIIFSVDKFKQMEHDVGGSPIIVTVKKEQLKRVAIISSKVLLKNYTQLPLEMLLFNAMGVYDKRLIANNGERYPIVFDKIKDIMTIGLESGVSSKINIEEITRKKAACVKVPLVCAEQSYNNIVMDVYTKGAVQFVDIKPALKILNYCSVPIQFALQAKTYAEGGLVFRTKPFEIYKFDPYKEACTLTLRANDTYAAEVDLFKFLNKGDGEMKVVLQSQLTNSSLKMYFDIINERRLNTLIIYSKFNLINETSLSLDFLSFAGSNPKKALPMVSNGEKTIFFMSEKKHTTIGIKLNQLTFSNKPELEISSQASAVCFFPKNINYNLNPKLSNDVEGKDFFELNLTVIPNVMRHTEKVVSKSMTIAPKYVFLNDTIYTLNFLQSSCQFLTSVSPHQRMPVIWKTKDKMCSFQLSEQDGHQL